MGSQHSKLGIGEENGYPNHESSMNPTGISDSKQRGTETPTQESTNYLNMNMIHSASS